MSRTLLSESNVHPIIQSKIGGGYSSVLNEVRQAIVSNAVVVVGMRQNPVCKSVRKNLAAENVEFQYLEYGSYFSEWKPRLAIKLWSGWPTFPMVFIKGCLIGGNHELQQLVASGELSQLLTK